MRDRLGALALCAVEVTDEERPRAAEASVTRRIVAESAAQANAEVTRIQQPEPPQRGTDVGQSALVIRLSQHLADRAARYEDNVKAKIRDSGANMGAIAAEVGVSLPHLSNWLHGRKTLKSDVMARLDAVVGKLQLKQWRLL